MSTLSDDLKGSLDWTGTSGRGAFALSFFVFLALTIYINIAVGDAPLSATSRILFALAGISLLVFVGQGRRRIRALGWRGGWTWLLVLPIAGIIFSLVLCARDDTGLTRRQERPVTRNIGFALAALLALFFVSRAFWGFYYLPSGSMKPSLLINDYVAVVPKARAPKHGEIIVFKHPTQDVEYIKRVIAVGGDTVALENGTVLLNGSPLPRTAAGTFTEVMEKQGDFAALPFCQQANVAIGETCEKARFVETLPNGRAYFVLDYLEAPPDNTSVFAVPEGHLFVLGDNRDNSLDSRMPQSIRGVGFVPIANVRGVIPQIFERAP